MSLTFDLDLGSFVDDVTAAKVTLERELADASFDAAADGIDEAQANHSYTDRTFQLTERAVPRRTAGGEAQMVWGKTYASFVDTGTSRAKPYPFTPQSTKRAQASLERRAEAAAQRFARSLSR
jgi:hypothetical protein